MAMTLRFSGVHLPAVCLIILNTVIIGAVHFRPPEKYAALFVFGNSFYDPGNNNYINTTTEYQENFWSYGETFFRFPTGSFSDGRLIPDVITELFQESEKAVKEQSVREAKELISSAVYLFSVGGNDYLSPLMFNSSLYDKFSKKEYVAMVLGNLAQVIKGIYKIGGRKFGLGSLLPLGCLPGTKILQPGNTGFKEADIGCCGSGLYRGVYSCGGKRGVKELELCDDVNDYFFFDSYHPTEKAYKQFAKLMWSGNSDITEPFNLKALFEL
ncbi:GDSL esterase/lipase 2 [Morus notabilis]|uniref:GDSL esterase/lipase 2 n=1 Tax=Morus notabilis TaxID=981085 RepID=W9RZW8_9ROSA|nr:GDSL esterase/lipase 2 [Morus notabilis]